MVWETFYWLPALEQVRGQTSTMEVFSKIVSNVNLKTSTIFSKRFILDAIQVDITQFWKFKRKYLPDSKYMQQPKMESF